jgi:hypothetical protein
MASMLRARTFLVASIAALLLACTQPIRNVADAPVPKPQLTEEQMAAAIKRAGAGLGWAMTEKGPGKMEGTLHLRKHVAVVDITYNPKTYSILYKDSTNLNYDPTGPKIHKNYNGWIQNLDNAIKVQLTNL